MPILYHNCKKNQVSASKSGSVAKNQQIRYYMGMEIRVIEDQKLWESGLASIDGEVDFISSWGWGNFQKTYGSRVVRWGFFDGNACLGVIYGIEQSVPFLGKFVYFPHCSARCLPQEFILYLKKIGYFMIRVEPTGRFACPVGEVCLPTKNRQPRQSLIFSLLGDEAELLARMHEKTRYNIRLAARKGVSVKESRDIDVFFALNEITTKRDGFKSHDKKYYEMMLANPQVKLFVAEFQGKPLAMAIGIIFGKTFVYLHGASSDQERNLMAPYLLQWEMMRYARTQGCINYDFWGVAPQFAAETAGALCFHNFCYDTHHSWAGVTRFKAGFGGNYVEYPEAFEIVLRSFRYKLFSVLKKVL